jgi:ABC-type sulfate transport system substrate-binding protein
MFSYPDIGIPLEKAKLRHGKPANQSVFLVQFQPTISGFQEAMRIHEHFSAKKHGKEEFQQMRGGKGKQAAPIDNLDELLYAHIAVAEDLGYLDEGTKRRCLIRCKTDIEAKANATLNMER